MPNAMKEILEDFANRLNEMIEAQTQERVKQTLDSAFGSAAPRRRGRPPKAAAGLGGLRLSMKPSTKPRKKAPVQLCPVPGCRNPAAPVFGMVCAKHKDLPKAKIKKYREARRAKKLGLKPAAKRVSAA